MPSRSIRQAATEPSLHEEYRLAKNWLEHGDRDAAHKLVTSHLRLVVEIAKGFIPAKKAPPAGAKECTQFDQSFSVEPSSAE